jgi:Fur family ferric uptake transcriptional regulator
MAANKTSTVAKPTKLVENDYQVSVSQTSSDLLRDHGLRATPQRVAVLDELAKERGDVTAQVLHARLHKQGKRQGLATVYRALGSLAERGVIDTLSHGQHLCYRFCSPGHHHHLTCRECHAVVEIGDCAVDKWARSIAERFGFAEVRHSVELTGTCPQCG